MDQAIDRLLRFHRFALDLRRGCLRDEEREIELRPKAFAVLRHLLDNSGRLVSKQELFEAVWPGVTVSDDSLVQCIRELRDKLHDEEHRLIKTVSRRGYVLDAAVESAEPRPGFGEPIVEPAERSPEGASGWGVPQRMLRFIKAGSPRAWVAVAAGLLCLVLAAFHLFGRSPLLIVHNLVAAPRVLSHPAFKDCDLCPEMVALPAGAFMMGSSESEAGRAGQEGPPRRVALTGPVAIGKFEITVEQFAAFVEQTGFEAGDLCRAFVLDAVPSEWPLVKGSFRAPGFRVTGTHPAVCVDWHDARAYTKWLAAKTGRPYRLPTEAEWEYAARAGTTTAYSFGDDVSRLCEFARFADGDSFFPWRSGCHSGTFEPGALRVGMLAPNPWGLFDMHGNAWEWTEDCWTSDSRLLPIDGSAYRRQEDCERRTVRGGGWGAERRLARSAARRAQPADARYYHVGFRVVLPLAAQ
jgi:formylglycine-generating enzyme required for sulfatase activity